MPTHNGERFIREALDSLLAQDYSNLEILISDNASTDRTPEIVREYGERDGRVRLVRHHANVGATANFNYVFAETTGPYFMWAADDDRWSPSYVRKCVAVLEADASAIMAVAGIRFIDERGDIIEMDYAPFDNPDLSAASVILRARMLLRRGGWYLIYGLTRREALSRTRLCRDVYGSDVVLSMELALIGRVVKIPEVLFCFRQYPSRTEADRAQRQGRISNKARVLQAKYTYLEESLTHTTSVAALPIRTKAALVLDIWRAAYIEETHLSRHTRGEILTRIRFAVHDRDHASLVKFALLGASVAGRRAAWRLFRYLVGRHA